MKPNKLILNCVTLQREIRNWFYKEAGGDIDKMLELLKNTAENSDYLKNRKLDREVKLNHYEHST